MAAVLTVGIAVAAQPLRRVQGIPYTPRANSGISAASDDWGDFQVPDDMPAPDGEFTFDMIKNWTGDGENRAALVIQWNDDKETNALVFGYKWNGQATGSDMIRAVVANNPRLYTLIQYTDVSSPTDPNGGYTINGFGWDQDNDGDIAIWDEKDNQVYETEDGVFIHPRGYDPDKGGSIDYDYDDWHARDTDDFWGAGWYQSYWSYWVKDDYSSAFGYSSWGASGRVLKDGSWDGWNFSLNMKPRDWKEFIAAPALIPDDAKTEFEQNGLCYTLTDYSNKSVKLVAAREGAQPYSGEITVPATFVDEEITYYVTEIDASAFEGTDITSLTIPATVTKIGAKAFKSSQLTTFNVTGREDFNNITKIGAEAFAGCGNLTTPVLPNTLTAIPDGVFKGTSIVNVELDERIESVGESSFEGCQKLTTLVLPSKIKSIGAKAFNGCTAITSIDYSSTYPVAISDDVFSETTYTTATLRVPYGYESTYQNASGWKNFTNLQTAVIPVNDGDIFSTGGVTYIVKSAENRTVSATYCKVEGTADDNSIKAANAAYTGDIIIPESVEYMTQTFNVVSIEEKAFYEAANITSMQIQAKVTEIPSYAFYKCTSMATISLPSTLTTIKTYAFSYAGIEKMSLPEGVTTLGERAFFQCNQMVEINLPTAMTEISNNCFSYCTSLKEIALGNQITTLGTTIFQNCKSLVKVTLPEGLTTIPANMFNNCSALETLDIPSGVKEIKNTAFSGCENLIVTLPASVTTLGTGVFKNCKKITEFTFPESITAIPNEILYGCTSLEKVNMSEKVTSIGSSSFKNCTSLKEVKFGAKLKTIGSYSYAGCTGLTEVNVPEGVTKLDTYAFQNCTSLKTVKLPSTLTTLGSYCLANTAIDSIIVPEKITAIATNTFDGCSSLTSVTLPEKLTTINGYAFRKTKLKEIVLPPNTALNSNDIFGNCDDIKVYLTGETPKSCSANGLRIKTGVFAPIYVPMGTADAYNAKASWNKAASITAPKLQSVTISEVKVSVPKTGAKTGAKTSSANMAISGNVNFVYDLENMPKAFVNVNDGIVKQNYTSSITVNGQEIPVEINVNDLTFSGTIPSDAIPESITLTIKENNSETLFTSESETVTTPKMITKINDTQVNVVNSMEATTLVDLVDYEPKDAELTDMDLFVYDMTSFTTGEQVNLNEENEFLTGYFVEEGKIRIAEGAESQMFEVRYHLDSTVKGMLYFNVSSNAVTEVYLDGVDESENIVLTANDILALKPAVLPEDADNKYVALRLENMTEENMATTYSVGGAEKFTELVTYKAGEFDLVLTSQENNAITRTYHVVVENPDNTASEDRYEAGVFWLNEDWFTHKNGSINYLTNPSPSSDDEIIYRAYGARNEGYGFGATSQYAMIFADKLFVMSKQNQDKGDLRGISGGRLVVADAHDLTRLASFDEIGGDGRACVGVSSEKVYVGTNAGIRVLRFDEENNFELAGANIAGIGNDIESDSSDIGSNQSLYNNQVGDMVSTLNHVYAIQQGIGVHVIDVETDELVKTIPDTGVQGITLSSDGNVWYASTANVTETGHTLLHEIDPATTEEINSYSVPGVISCSWGSWRSTNFFASKEQPILFWASASNSGIVESGTTIYKWVIGEDPANLEPLYSIPAIEGMYPDTKRVPYGTMRYDDRSNSILYATTTAPSGNYRWNWYNFLDVSTQEATIVALKPYYWFPAMPLFPDKYAPEFKNLPNSIEIDMEQTQSATSLDLSNIVSDQDNLDSNIRLTHEIDNELNDICEVTKVGSTLQFAPTKTGSGSLSLIAESNGRKTTVNIPVNIKLATGVDAITHNEGRIVITENRVNIYGLSGMEFLICSANGNTVSGFRAEGEESHIVLSLPAGVYILRSIDNSRTVKFLIK